MGEILSFEQLHKVIKVKNTKWPEIICNNLMWNLVNIVYTAVTAWYDCSMSIISNLIHNWLNQLSKIQMSIHLADL